MLIVDDDARICDLLEDLFAGEGHEVTTASDGISAWAYLQTSPHPLVVILDEVLPGLRGLDLLQRVADDPSLAARHAFILLTATAHRLASPALPLPVPIIPKPCDLEALLVLVTQTANALAAPH
jgi:CheY-like chemotaxis protein